MRAKRQTVSAEPYTGQGRARERLGAQGPGHVATASPLAAGVLAVCLSLGLGFGLGGCSMSLPIGALGEETITTGSIVKASTPLSPALSGEDWRRAQAALGLAVDPQGNGAPVSWDNPESGKKGSFVAAGPLYVVDDQVCRSFIASLNAPTPDTQLQGSSCRLGPNEWVVREAKPFRAASLTASEPLPPKRD